MSLNTYHCFHKITNFGPGLFLKIVTVWSGLFPLSSKETIVNLLLKEINATYTLATSVSSAKVPTNTLAGGPVVGIYQ